MKKLFLMFAAGLLLCAPLAAEEMPGLKAGVKAPDFEATAHDGSTVKLSDKIAEGPAVLVFYRGGWCMYCNRQLQELQGKLAEFEALNASIVAISVDLQSNAAKSVEEKQLGFTVISDPEAKLLDLYGLMHQVPDDTVGKYVEYGIDLKAASGRDDHVISIPATYVIRPDGIIAYAYANEDYTIRKSADDLIAAIKTLSP